jgi:hypothetical protein
MNRVIYICVEVIAEQSEHFARMNTEYIFKENACSVMIHSYHITVHKPGTKLQASWINTADIPH